ncbi:MAG: ABC transporter substrate-binding protein [Anaerolineae bacterium]|nr:ABC transporter substrate-binding protein [Anaerolineae bacterium]
MKRLICLLLIALVLIPFNSPVSMAQSAPFTIQAATELQPALSALYRARYGAEPTFVQSNGDLIATNDLALRPLGMVSVPPHFLPDAFLLLARPNAEAEAFIAFAASPDGQAALIESGFLPKSVTVTDQAGNTVEIAQPVRRVITPYSIATYLVYGVGAADRLVAAGYLGTRTPVGAARMSAIDPRFPTLSGYTLNQREINIEQVAQLAPDLIITSARTAWLDTVRELNIPFVLLQGESRELLKESVLLVGQLLGPNAQARARAWVDYYDDIFTQVVERTKDVTERPKVLFVGESPLRVISGQMYQTDIIAAAGGRSVSAELKGFWNDVNLEQVALWNPDVIVIAPYGNVTPQTFKESPEWAIIKAVQDGKVYKMPSWVAPWDTPVMDSVLGVIWLAQKLFPERVTLDCAREAVYFFKVFYNHDLPESEIAAVCGS